jgi:DNA-binding HxlR family transcriptional regulator
MDMESSWFRLRGSLGAAAAPVPLQKLYRLLQFLYWWRHARRPIVRPDASGRTRMAQPGYGQFCPVAMAAELLCNRWTIVLLRELGAGSTRFGDLRRGVARMSPTLLSQRLRELEEAGIIERRRLKGERGVYAYHMTESGRDLQPVIEAMGRWGQRWISARESLLNLDPALLMCDMRRNLDATLFPQRRTVLRFHYPEQKTSWRNWWLIVEADREVELQAIDPGHNADLVAVADLRTMTAIWMGLSTVAGAGERLRVSGAPELAARMQQWLGLSPFAAEPKRVAA